MDTLIFEPLDTLFFRDGRPFNQGEANFGVESLFPPSPRTLVGAVRGAWARHLGWDGKTQWPENIRKQVGGDGGELEGIRFCGPLLRLNGQPVYPAPALLMGTLSGNAPPENIVRLKPGEQPMRCDLGEAVRLPAADVDESDRVEGRKLLSGWWLTQAGMNQVLYAGIPAQDQFIARERLWIDEPRVGNSINADKGVTEQGMLYATRHVRLRPGVTLAVGVEGTPKDFPRRWIQVPLGGESRSCWLSSQPGKPLDLKAGLWKADGKIRYAVHVLTPLNPTCPPKPGKPFEDLPGTVVSACLPRAQRWGGWDGKQFEPSPMTPHLPPGSVLFMEADLAEEQAILDKHGTHAGRHATWGFGLLAIGRWN